MKLRSIILMLITSCVLSTPQQAVISIESITSFYKSLDNNDMVIAHFYFKGKEQEKNSTFKENYNRDTSMFRATDDLQPLVRFIKINTERPHLQELAKKYGIQPGRTPAFILFYKGDKMAKKHIASGEINVSKLQDFIHEYFKDHIKEKINKIKKRREEERRYWLLRRKYLGDYIYTYPFFTHHYYCPYHYGYHPYSYRCRWHNGYYYGRPGFYFGVGIH